MSPLERRCLLALVLTPACAAGAGAQQLEAPSFVFARYATASASALYAARGFGPLGGFTAMVQNPETQYREIIAGVHTQATWEGGRQSILVAIAYADATDGRYVQTYVSPSLAAGVLSFSATIEWYAPLERAGVRQLGVNPATLAVKVGRGWTMGVAATLDLAPGSPAAWRAGPTLEWTTRWGVLRTEVLDRSSGKATEIRTSVLAAF